MSSRAGIVVLLGVTLLVGVAGWIVWRPLPNLNGVERLLSAGRFDDAEQRIRGYLAANPGSPGARLLLAQISVDRPEPKPDYALEQLKLLRPTSKAMTARASIVEGRALFLLDRFAASQRAFERAIQLDPLAQDAAWGLLNQYSLQERFDDTSRLALQFHARVPNYRDRVRFLLEIVHYDVIRSEVALVSRVFYLEKAVAADPTDVASRLALGSTLVRTGQADAGLSVVRQVIKDQPANPRAWEIYMDALQVAGESDELAKALDDLPPALQQLAPFLDARGRLAQQRGDWVAAAEAYRRARDLAPYDRGILSRLVAALRRAGRPAEAAELGPTGKAIDAAQGRLGPLYAQADLADKSGQTLDAGLCESFADALRTLGRTQEAEAWLRLARGERPNAQTADPRPGPRHVSRRAGRRLAV